jgi:methionyl-tRNA synthetase
MLQGSDDEKAEAARVLLAVLEGVRIVAVMLSPITPGISQKLYEQLGYDQGHFDSLTWADTQWGGLKAGQVTATPAPVFARIEGDYVIGGAGASAKPVPVGA